MKPLVMILGLAGLGGFSYASWSSLHEGVAQKLTTQAQAAVDASGDLEGVTVSFDHLDGIVKGATTEETQQKAKEVILAALPAGRIISFAGDEDSASDAMEATTSSHTLDGVAALADATPPPTDFMETESPSTPEADVIPTESPIEASDVLPIVETNAPEPTTTVEPIDIAKASPPADETTGLQFQDAETHRIAATDLEAQRAARLEADAARLTQDTEARTAAASVADTPPNLNPPGGEEKAMMAKKKPRLGVYIEADIESTLVRYVDPESAADKAGLKIGDTLSRLGGQSISNFDDLATAVNGFNAGDEVEIWYRRDGRLKRTKATLLERVEPEADATKADAK